jgi:hypothetical protein
VRATCLAIVKARSNKTTFLNEVRKTKGADVSIGNVEMITSSQRKAVPLEVRGSIEIVSTLPRSAFLWKYEQKFAEIERLVKFFYSGSYLFIGARGQFQELASIQLLRDLRRTRVHSNVPRVMFFTRILRFSWNRIVGVNPLPRGASAGKFRKTRHPRNTEFYEIREISFQESWTCEAQESWTCEDLESWTCEALKSQTCEDPKPWTCEARNLELVKIWNLEPVKPWGREPMKTRSHEPVKPRNRRSAKLGNLLKFGFGSHDVWRFPGWGDSRISGKPSQRRHLKKSGFGEWTGGRLVNVWDVKDVNVHVHTWNIPWVRGISSECKSPFVSL